MPSSKPKHNGSLFLGSILLLQSLSHVIRVWWQAVRPYQTSGLELLFFLGLSLCTRLPFLSWKPPHFDEGINWWFVQGIWERGFFIYDPFNYHGPLHFYLLWLVEAFLGDGVAAYRLWPVLLSALTVVVLLHFKEFIGAWGGRLAALAFAISPAMTFYSRYAIHESLFVFSLSLIWLGYAKWCTGAKVSGFRIFLMGLTVALTTKETIVLHVLGLVLAEALRILFVYGQNRAFLQKELLSWRKNFKQTCQMYWALHGAVALWCFFLFSLLYTGGFRRLQGLGDFFLAFMPWAKTGLSTEGGHVKPFFYWMELLWQWEWPFFLGFVIACLIVLFFIVSRFSYRIHAPTNGTVFFAFSALFVFLAYSLIPYKTPWCVISVSWLFVLPLGWGVQRAFSWFNCHSVFALRWGGVSGLVLLIGLLYGKSIYESFHLNFINYNDKRHPYVYVQTDLDYLQVQNLLNLYKGQVLSGAQKKVLVISKSYWPLPWALKDYKNKSYTENVPEEIKAAIVIIDESFLDEVSEKIKSSYWSWTFHLRDAHEPMRILIPKEPEFAFSSVHLSYTTL